MPSTVLSTPHEITQSFCSDPVIIPALPIRRWRHGEVQELARGQHTAELRWKPKRCGSWSVLLTIGQYCLSVGQDAVLGYLPH